MARQDRNGLYFQRDFWNTVAHLPTAQQDKALGAMIRLFFTGADDAPKGSAPKCAYLGVRERIICSRNKSNGDDESTTNEPANDHQSYQETTTNEPANDHSSIKEGEGDRYISSSSGRVSSPDIQPVNISLVDTEGNPSYAALFVANSIVEYTKVTGRTCLMPSGLVKGYLTRIYDAGYSIEDIRLVCKSKFDEWKDDPRQQKWIRPETFFEPSKFEGYLQAAKNDPEVKINAEAAEFAGAF